MPARYMRRETQIESREALSTRDGRTMTDFLFMIPPIALIFTAATAIVSIYGWRKSEKRRKDLGTKTQYLEDALANLETIENDIKSLSRHTDTSSHEFLFSDATGQLQILVGDILRAWFQSKENEIAVRYRITDVRTRDKANVEWEKKPVSQLANALVGQSSVILDSEVGVVGLETDAINSLGFREMCNVKDELLCIRDKLGQFKTVYENLGGQLFERVEQGLDGVSQLLTKYVLPEREMAVPLHKFKEAKEVDSYLLNEMMGFGELHALVKGLQQDVLECVTDMRKELFKLTYSNSSSR